MGSVTSRRRGREEDSLAAAVDKGVEGREAEDERAGGVGGGVGPTLDVGADPPPPPPAACDWRSCFLISSNKVFASASKGFISAWYCLAMDLPSGVRLIQSVRVVLTNAKALSRSSTSGSLL